MCYEKKINLPYLKYSGTIFWAYVLKSLVHEHGIPTRVAIRVVSTNEYSCCKLLTLCRKWVNVFNIFVIIIYNILDLKT